MNRLPEESTPLHTEAAGTPPPDAFGPFRVLHQVGAGALGPVFRAYDQDRDRLVAIKLFRFDLAPERVHVLVDALTELVQTHLTHPVMAAPLAAGTAGGYAYLVQEFVPADSLDVVVRDYGPAPAIDAVRLATQVAGALDFAAVVNVVHGGLHPRDVLVSREETRLTGLGITQALERAGAAVSLRRPYAAPERVAGGAWDRRADIFSLAAVIHDMLWGRRLAGTGTAAAASLTELPHTSLADLRDVFAKALADDPAERFDTALGFAEGLKHACREALGAETAPPPTPERRSRRGSSTRKGATHRLPLDASADGIAADAGISESPATAAVPANPALSANPAVPAAEFGEARPPAAAHDGASDALAQGATESLVDEPVAEPALERLGSGGSVGPAMDPDDFQSLPTDLELRTAQAERFSDVEAAPSVLPEPELEISRSTEPSMPLEVPVVEPPGSPVVEPMVTATPAGAPGELADARPRRVRRRYEPETPVVSKEVPAVAADDSYPREPAVAGGEDRARSAFWMVVLALVLGIALGFAAGYTLGSWQRPLSVVAEAPAPPAMTAPAARDAPPPAVDTTPLGTKGPTMPASAPAAAPTSGAAAASANASAGTRPTAPPTKASRAAAAPPPTPVAPDAPGRLVVRTTPAGARVIVDGEDRGRTPVTVRELSRGVHRLRIEHDGFVTVERRVAVTRARTEQSVTVALVRPRAAAPAKPAPASRSFVVEVAIDSRPSAAKVFLDGRLVGATPLVLRGIAAGEHLLRLESDGYRRWSSLVRVQAGERNRVTASLEK